MRILRYTFTIAFVACGMLHAQSTYPFGTDSYTRALWHLDEPTGLAVADSSTFHNNGEAIGTTIVQGKFGYARSFNGSGDYINFPSDSSMNFGNDSFTIDVWFKTTAEEGMILRRGLAPAPGYLIQLHSGYVLGQIGANTDPGGPDPLLSVQSTNKCNDNLWHHARLVRDRASLMLELYIDDVKEDAVPDNLLTPIITDRPLTLGRWENIPQYFMGSIDEVRLWSPKGLRLPVQISISQSKLTFGTIRVGATDTLPLAITNIGTSDTLSVDSIISSSSSLTFSDVQFKLGPGESRNVRVVYAPDAARLDTGLIMIMSNDSTESILKIWFSGRGIILTQGPIIDEVRSDAWYSSQVRVTWFRSMQDSAGASDPVTQYTIWGRNNTSVSSSLIDPQSAQVREDGTLDAPWLYLATVPSAQFEEYAAAVPHPYSVSSLGYWNECVVAAHTVDHKTYLSLPDTLIPSPSVTGIEETKKTEPQGYSLFQNYPNPFNPTTGIRYQVTGDRDVRLAVYDVLGREVAVLVDGRVGPGTHEVHFDGSKLSSGVYFYRLTSGTYVATKAMLLEK